MFSVGIINSLRAEITSYSCMYSLHLANNRHRVIAEGTTTIKIVKIKKSNTCTGQCGLVCWNVIL